MLKNYETPPAPGNPREVEAWGLTQAALRLKAAKESGETEVVLAAVRINWQLWTILQAELLSPECPLPDDIRNNGISLANFIDKYSMDLIANPDHKKLDVLININRELAAGLRTPLPGSSKEKEKEEEAEVPQGLGNGEITA